MSNLRATRACDKLLPQDIEESVNEQGGLVRTVKNCEQRLGFKLGYKTAEKETTERAGEWWFEHIKGFLGDGLARGCVEQFKNEMEEA